MTSFQPLTTNHSASEKPPNREHKLMLSVEADRRSERDHAERRLCGNSEVNVLARDGGCARRTHLSNLHRPSQVDVAAQWRRRCIDPAQVSRRRQPVVRAAKLMDGQGAQP